LLILAHCDVTLRLKIYEAAVRFRKQCVGPADVHREERFALRITRRTQPRCR